MGIMVKNGDTAEPSKLMGGVKSKAGGGNEKVGVGHGLAMKN